MYVLPYSYIALTINITYYNIFGMNNVILAHKQYR